MSERDEPATAETPCAETPDSRARAQDPPDVYDLLLALAGRLDDDLLAWARELVAVGEEGQAVELVTAALAAERVMLPAAVRVAVVAAGRAAHTDLDVGRELAPPVPDDATVHRFNPAAASGDRVAAVLAGLPARRLAGCTLYLTWRSTPAGAAPGPVPRAVVLVEAGPDRSADVLVYLLATELDRAAVPASVEVFTTGTTLPAYHRAALAAARRIEVGASVIAPAGVVVARTAAEAAARAAARPAGSAGLATPASVDPAAATGRAEPTVPAELEAGAAAGREIAAARGTDTAALFVVPSPDEITPLPAAPRRAARRRRSEAGETAEPAFAGGPATTGTGSADGGAADAIGAPIPPVPDLRTSRPTPTRSMARCGFRCWRRCSIPRPRGPTNRTTGPRIPPRSVPCPRSRRPGETRRLPGTSRRSRPRPRPGVSRLGATPPPSRPAHVPTLDRAASSRRASSPTFRPAGGDGTPTTSRPARPGRSPPSWRRVTRVRRVGRMRARPDTPDTPDSDDVPQEWEDDWRSGEWAMPPALPPLPPADRAEPVEAFDVFGTPTSHGTVENAAERTGRTPLPSRTVPEVPGSPLPHRAPPERHAVGPIGSGQPDERTSEARTFRRGHGPHARAAAGGSSGPYGRRDGTPSDGPHGDAVRRVVVRLAHRTGQLLVETARTALAPDPAPDRRVTRDVPCPWTFRPRSSDDVPLFGEAAAPTRGVPEGPAPDLPRTGRRRRPDADEPETAAPPATDVESSLLNSTEGDLLAQLQAELAGRERRPRPYRRARTDADPAANGHGVNGHAADEHGVNGHGGDGPNGHDTNGHDTNGHGTNGHGTNGHGTNGHGNGPPGDRPSPDVSG